MDQKNKIKFLLRILGVIILLFIFIKSCVIPGIKHYSESNIDKEEMIKRKRIAIKEYTRLFPAELRKKLVIHDSYINKSKHAVVSLGYDNMYHICVYKVSSAGPVLLNDFVEIEKKDAGVSPGIVYSGYTALPVHFNFASDNDSLPKKKLYLTYTDTLLKKTVVGDSIHNYNFIIRNLSCRFEKEGTRDIVLEIEGPETQGPNQSKELMNVTLYKRDSFIYIIFVMPTKQSSRMDDSLLKRLFGIQP